MLDGQAAHRSYQRMDDDQRSPSAAPPTGPPHRSVTEIRRTREAEALRENLRRRKEQQRARAVPEPDAGQAPDPNDTA
jgi:hypothetical protein